MAGGSAAGDGGVRVLAGARESGLEAFAAPEVFFELDFMS
jgi:hypothetical protein